MSPCTGSSVNANCDWIASWASHQMRKIAGCACAGNARNVFPATDFKENRWLVIPACITARDVCRNRSPTVAGKLSRHCRCMCNPQFYVSGKWPMCWMPVTIFGPLTWETHIFLCFINRSISQLPQFTCPISHNTQPRNRNVHISVPMWCILGYKAGVVWYTTVVAKKKLNKFMDLRRLTHMCLFFVSTIHPHILCSLISLDLNLSLFYGVFFGFMLKHIYLYLLFFFCCDFNSLLDNLMFTSLITLYCAYIDISCISNISMYVYK